MTGVYYNEWDAFAAQWLRNLMTAGLIPAGDVDERSITEVSPDDVRGYTQCHFFAGIGGWAYALQLAGWSAIRPVWTGSCPCQPFSAAGKRKGFEDDRHLWPAFRGIIEKCRPATVFGEQVASATDWLSLVRSDLEAMGYAVASVPIEAASAGAFHLRDRYWFVANSEGEQVGAAGQPWERGDVGNDPGLGRREGRPEHEVRSGRIAVASNGSADMANAQYSGCQGGQSSWHRTETALPHGGDLAEPLVGGERRHARDARGQASARCGEAWSSNGNSIDGARAGGSGNMADANESCGRLGNEQPARQLSQYDGTPGTCVEWATGADGKARPVEPGVRLLAHGFPNRVGLLRGFGNAIDPRPAAHFIAAFMEAA